MEKLVFGFTVALIGMSIVFCGLVILIGLIKVLTAVTTKNTAPKAAEKKAPVVETPVETIEESAAEQDDNAIVAAISAAIACILGEGQGFTVKHIRRITK